MPGAAPGAKIATRVGKRGDANSNALHPVHGPDRCRTLAKRRRCHPGESSCRYASCPLRFMHMT